MRENKTAEPFGLLGRQLRMLRTKARETLAETSGSVEIEVGQLVSYELGKERPSEEVLLLLINHFEPQEMEALKLWRLAGYSTSEAELPEEPPAIYTDNIEVSANQLGLVIDFKQTPAAGHEMKSISKVGMSREQAERLIKTLSIAMAKTAQTPKLLLPDNDSAETEDS